MCLNLPVLDCLNMGDCCQALASSTALVDMVVGTVDNPILKRDPRSKNIWKILFYFFKKI